MSPAQHPGCPSHWLVKPTPVTRGGCIARRLREHIDDAVACPRSRARLYAQEAERLRGSAVNEVFSSHWRQSYTEAADCLAVWATTLEALAPSAAASNPSSASALRPEGRP